MEITAVLLVSGDVDVKKTLAFNDTKVGITRVRGLWSF